MVRFFALEVCGIRRSYQYWLFLVNSYYLLLRSTYGRCILSRMGLYNFRRQFTAKILNGEKRHTIRLARLNPDRPGSTLHLYTGLRTKAAKLLMRVPCVKVETITIKDGAFGDENHAAISIDGLPLDRSEREALAVRDGFENLEQMIQFWRCSNRLPFEGHIIHWNFDARVTTPLPRTPVRPRR
jgi:hypothetical protein